MIRGSWDLLEAEKKNLFFFKRRASAAGALASAERDGYVGSRWSALMGVFAFYDIYQQQHLQLELRRVPSRLL